MGKYLQNTSTTPKRFLFSRVTFAIGETGLTLLITNPITGKFGKALKNWMEKQ
jgi:hypothetical protein